MPGQELFSSPANSKNGNGIPHVRPKVGKARVKFFNYGDDESPLSIPPSIILLRPNETNKSSFDTGKFWENLGVLTLVSHLEKHGIKLGALEASLFQCSRKKTVELITQYKPKYVGISVFSTDILEECLEIARAIKRKNKSIITVLGGHGASFVHKHILEDNKYVDIVFRGEAENWLVQLIKSKGKEEWAAIPSMSFRNNGNIIVNSSGAIEKDLDRVLLPNRFARDIMSQDSVLSKAPLMSVSSRGCFDTCKFCSVTAFYANLWRSRSPKNIVDEIEYLVKRYNRKSIHFWDDLFIGPGKKGRERVIEISEEILRRKLGITFHITTRAPGLTEDLIRIMVKAGLRSVFLGIESGLDDTLKYYGKHARVEHGTNAVKMLWENGVYRILMGYILFHPKMTWAEFRHNLDYLNSFPYVEICRIYSRLGFYPGAEYWRELEPTLGKDAYKRTADAPLPNDDFERLNDICYWFHGQTFNLEPAIVTLEEEYLHEDRVIQFLARCRKRIFGHMAEGAIVAADNIESGRDDYEDALEFGHRVKKETISVIKEMRDAIPGPYLEWLIKVYKFDALKI